MKFWDPIGVNDEPYATDEYDMYIPDLLRLNRERASVEKVMTYLDDVATKRMGFTSQRELGRPSAERIVALGKDLA